MMLEVVDDEDSWETERTEVLSDWEDRMGFVTQSVTTSSFVSFTVSEVSSVSCRSVESEESDFLDVGEWFHLPEVEDTCQALSRHLSEEEKCGVECLPKLNIPKDRLEMMKHLDFALKASKLKRNLTILELDLLLHVAVDYQVLHMVWPIVSRDVNFSLPSAIVIRHAISTTDYRFIREDDLKRFIFSKEKTPSSTITLSVECECSKIDMNVFRVALNDKGDFMFKRSEENMPAMHNLIRYGQVDCVLACLETQEPIDFTVTGPGGKTVFHCVCEVEDVKNLKKILDALINRFLKRKGSGNPDKVNWLMKDESKNTFLSYAAERCVLRHVWVVIKKYVRTIIDDLPLVILSYISPTDWNSIDERDRKEFFIFTKKHDSVQDETMLLAVTCDTVAPNANVVSHYVGLRADIFFRRHNNSLPLLHRLIRDGHVECVLACLRSSESIDFTVTDWYRRTVLHHVAKRTTGVEDSLRMLKGILERLRSESRERNRSSDLWCMRDLEGDDFVSCAARSKILSRLWPMVKGLPAFSPDNGLIPIRAPVDVEDWEQLGRRDQFLFECTEGQRDATWKMYELATHYEEHHYDKVKQLLSSTKERVNLCLRRDSMCDSILNTFIKTENTKCFQLCMESDQEVNFSVLDERGRRPLNLLCEVSGSGREIMLSAVVSRLRKREKDASSIKWDYHVVGVDLFSYAALHQCFHTMWNALKGFSDVAKDFEKTLSVISIEDYNQLDEAERDTFSCDMADPTDLLFAVSLRFGEKADEIDELLARGARFDVRKPYMKTTALHNFISDGKVACVEKCMCTARDIDFTVTDEDCSTFFHVACHPSDPQVSTRLLQSLVYRLIENRKNDKIHKNDQIVLEMQDNLKNDFLSHATSCGMLSYVWPILKRYPYFSGKKKKDIKIRVNVQKEDEDHLGEIEKDYFAFPDQEESEKNRLSKSTRSINGTGKEDIGSLIKKKVLSYRTGHCVGSGTYGEVRVGRVSDGREIAIKNIIQGPEDCFRNEANIAFSSDHDHIVTCFGFLQCGEGDEIKKFIFFERCVCSLQNLIDNYTGIFTMPVVQKYTQHILKGLNYLHKKKILHRDIKPSNILVTKEFVGKITDFGVSKAADGTTLIGTKGFYAPELLQANSDNSYSTPADIWSVGVTVLVMLGRKVRGTVDCTKDIVRDISSENSIDLILPGRRCTEELHAFFKKCLNPQAENRSSAEDLLKKDTWLNCPAQDLNELKCIPETKKYTANNSSKNGRESRTADCNTDRYTIEHNRNTWSTLPAVGMTEEGLVGMSENKNKNPTVAKAPKAPRQTPPAVTRNMNHVRQMTNASLTSESERQSYSSSSSFPTDFIRRNSYARPEKASGSCCS